MTAEENNKFFLKIRETKSDNPYYLVEKDCFKLLDPLRKTSTSNALSFDFKRVFQNEEQSYIYEEICRGAAKNLVAGNNQIFLGYGTSKSGKSEILLGNDDLSDITNWGMVHRLIEQLKKEGLEVELKRVMVNKNCFYDLNKIAKSNLKYVVLGDLEAIGEKQCTSEVEDILEAQQVVKIIKVTELDANIFEALRKIDEDNNRHFLTKSHFIYSVKASNSTGKFANAIFCVLAGSELNIKSLKGNNTKDNIYIQSTFSSVLAMFDAFKNNTANYNAKDNLVTGLLFPHLNKNAHISVLGSIFPGTGLYDVVKETMAFLQKIVSILLKQEAKKKELNAHETELEELKFFYESKLKQKETAYSSLLKQIEELRLVSQNKDKRYAMDLESIKKNFSFEGDIKKLTKIDDGSNEFIIARRMKDAADSLGYMKSKIKEQSSVIDKMKFDLKRYEMQVNLMDEDNKIVTTIEKQKEKNRTEEERVRIKYEVDNKMHKLIDENRQLVAKIRCLEEELEKVNKQIKILPEVLNEKIDQRKKFGEQIKHIEQTKVKEFEDNLQRMRNSQLQELKRVKTEVGTKLEKTELSAKELKTKLQETEVNMKKEEKEHSTELVKLFIMITKLIAALEDNFESNGGKLAEKSEQIRKGVLKKLTKENYPLLFKNVENSNTLKVKLKGYEKGKFEMRNGLTNAETKEDQLSLTLSLIEQMEQSIKKEIRVESTENLEKLSKSELLKITLEMQTRALAVENKFKDIKLKLNNKGMFNLEFVAPQIEDSFDDREITKMKHRIQNLATQAVRDKIVITAMNRDMASRTARNFLSNK